MKTCLVLFLAAAHVSLVNAQSPGTFRATGKMLTPRFFHTATLLLDGRVLIAGGESSYGMSPAEASAELYDPATGLFAPTANMTVGREAHTATLLPNGKVLIAGGKPSENSNSLASAELYDPSTGTFTATGDMIERRVFHTATLLANGNVLIAGGLQWLAGNASTQRILASAELYDPSTGTFVPTGSMNEAYSDTATLLPDGTVLVTRGISWVPQNSDGSEIFVRHAEIYDPATGTFTFTGNLSANHTAPTAQLLTNGKVLIAGGDIGDGDGASVSAELYDPPTRSFAATGNLGIGREQNATTVLPDGEVLFAGGHCNCVPVSGGGHDNLSSAEVYNPASGEFSATGSMLIGRDLLVTTLLSNGEVLVTGGNEYYPCCAGARDPFHPEVAAAELYTPSVVVSPPALFSTTGDARGQGAIWHAKTGQVASPSSPVVGGEILSMYTTSLVENGVVPPQVAIGGILAEVLYFGDAPGYPGFNQVNFRVPANVVPGSAVPVRLTYLSRPSNEVTIGVQ